ncbi:MAG TPA: thiamine-binding protein [Burkholderiaceae bacterium]
MAHPKTFPSSRLFFLLSLVSLAALSALAGSTASAEPSTQQAPSTAAATPTPAQHMIAEIQVIPRPAGTASDRYKHVDAAIAVIQASGLHYEVNGMGTVVEGPAEKVWPLLQAVHQATLESGAERTLTIIKVSSSAQAGGPRVADLVGKFRK